MFASNQLPPSGAQHPAARAGQIVGLARVVDGRVLHFCDHPGCGAANAGFGVKCDLRRYQQAVNAGDELAGRFLGLWFCADHRPPLAHEQSQSQPAIQPVLPAPKHTGSKTPAARNRKSARTKTRQRRDQADQGGLF